MPRSLRASRRGNRTRRSAYAPSGPGARYPAAATARGARAPEGPSSSSGVDADFAVAVGIPCLRGEKETPGAGGGEPPGHQQRRARLAGGRPVEQILEPAAHVAQLWSAPPQEREHRPRALRGAQEVGDGVTALGECIGAN